MKVAELTGAILDRWVAEAEVHKDIRIARWVSCNSCCDFCVSNGEGVFSPSTNWSQGGPIIEREKVWLARSNYPNHGPVFAYVGESEEDAIFRAKNTYSFGPTPLIAAMRCYVASKFGDTVPDEVA